MSRVPGVEEQGEMLPSNLGWCLEEGVLHVGSGLSLQPPSWERGLLTNKTAEKYASSVGLYAGSIKILARGPGHGVLLNIKAWCPNASFHFET